MEPGVVVKLIKSATSEEDTSKHALVFVTFVKHHNFDWEDDLGFQSFINVKYDIFI